MRYHKLLALASVGSIVLAGCDAGGFVTASELEVPVQVSVDVANLEVAGVAVEVTGPGINQPIIANLPIANGAATGTVAVLAGSSRAFQLRAFNAQGIETHNGADTVDVAGSETSTLNVSLTPLVGDVGVDGRIGTYTLAVSSPATTISVGQTAQLTVSITDAYGNTVSDAQVAWGSSNPAVAPVTSGGVVEGLVVGTTTIGASYKGFSGTLTITVQ
jgi:hypothetical protein